MEKPLVSLLTPSYNTGKFIHRLLGSVLEQTWSNLEMIVVDDGSTDDTGTIAESFIPKFEARGYSLRLIRQENAGQSAAIQNGLEFVRGKYLAWPDSDDFYASPFAVEEMVTALENAPKEFALVRTQEQVLDELDLSFVGLNGKNVKAQEEKSLFEDCLFARNGFYFCSGAYLVRLDALKSSALWPMYVEKNAGQNWQLLLPVLWNFRCLSIRKVLYSVIGRQNSHSRGQYKGYAPLSKKFSAYANTIQGTLDRILNMPTSIRDEYRNQIRQKYDFLQMRLAFRYNRAEEFFEYWRRLPKHSTKDRCAVILMRLHLVGLCAKLRLVYNSFRGIVKNHCPKFLVSLWRKADFRLRSDR